MSRMAPSKLPRYFIYTSSVVFAITMMVIYFSRAQACTVELKPVGWTREGRGFSTEAACEKALAHCKLFQGMDQKCEIIQRD